MPINELSNTSKENQRALNINASAPTELSAVVEDLLNTLSNKFAGVSSEIFAKMDEMSRRLDNLEDSLKNNQSQENEGPQK